MKGAAVRRKGEPRKAGVDGDLLLADRHYGSYGRIALLQARGADSMFQQHQRRPIDFHAGQRVGLLDQAMVWNKPRNAV